MKKVIFSFFAFLMFCTSACIHGKKAHPEDLFLGDWYKIKGDADAYSFLKDSSSYIFTGSQGMRPVVYGTWKIKKNKFILSIDKGTTSSFKFTLSNDTLILNDGEEMYTRTTPAEVRNPEITILINLSGSFPALKFTAPLPDDLSWYVRSDSMNVPKNVTLRGFSINAMTTSSSGVLPEISDYLSDRGYEKDTVFKAEKCYGFSDNNLIVTVCTNSNPKIRNDSLNIHITSGILNK